MGVFFIFFLVSMKNCYLNKKKEKEILNVEFLGLHDSNLRIVRLKLSEYISQCCYIAVC